MMVRQTIILAALCGCTTQPAKPPAHDFVTVAETVQQQAVMAGGPNTYIKYVARTSLQTMSAAWKAAEVQGVYARLHVGDQAGAQQVHRFIMQMSRQATSVALMNADRALAAGDGVTAAQQLARAHAFFPDGTMGRFGVDKSASVWASRVSEADPTMQIGEPLEVTRQNLQAQMVASPVGSSE